MTNELASDPSSGRYGPLSFGVALAHIFVVGLATWLYMPYSIIFVLPVVLVYMALAALVALASGKVGQIGRGMLIGSLSGPFSLIIFGAVWAIAQAIGPI